MLTVQHNRVRRQRRQRGPAALLVLMLLATLLWPAAVLAQDPAPVTIPTDEVTDVSVVSEFVIDPSIDPATGAPLNATPLAVENLPPMGYGAFPLTAEDAAALEAESAALEAELAAGAAAVDTAATTDAAVVDLADATFTSRLPFASNDWQPNQADRIGYGAGTRPLSSFPTIRSLNAGWYVNWSTAIRPQRPGGMQFMQMVRLHQNLVDGNPNDGITCGKGVTADRTICPYAVPHSYTPSTSLALLPNIAKANPGAVWLIGNEMERADWAGGTQDEMLPELYAQAYHEVRAAIKSGDPTAKIAIGGIIQFTPLRAQYLDKVWNAYLARYGVKMPVDVWNVHNFIGPEICITSRNELGFAEKFCYGMGIPVGVTGTVIPGNPNDSNPNNDPQEQGAYMNENWKVISKATFEEQIRGMRAWMKAKGEWNKPLIVTEYGVLFESLCPDVNYPTPALKAQCVASYGSNYVDLENPAVIHDFMIWTFEFFRTEKDCTLTSYDECRLVQQWAWFGLDDVGWDFNPHAVLMDAATSQPTAAGRLYRDYVNDKSSRLQLPNGKLP